MRYFLVFITAILLSGCWIETSSNYNISMTSMRSESKNIGISIPNKKQPHYYFILSSSTDDGDPKDVLKVRWVSKNKNRKTFDGMKSTLRFIINKEEVITLHPRSFPVRIGYNINDGTCEEEGIYNITREQLKKLAYAESVDVELTGNHMIVVGKFTKYHTSVAFRNFLKNT